MHYRRLAAGGGGWVIVDADWYVDYCTLDTPLDLAKSDASVIVQSFRSKD